MDSEGSMSPLTDMELDEPSATSVDSKSTRKRKALEFSLGEVLKAPRATTYAAQSLYDQISRGNIDLNPEYQRDVVWSAQKQSSLIDSIFRNCYVPPVIFSVETNKDGSEVRVCIDGKQRLSSIHAFMSGTIPFKDLYTGDQLWYERNEHNKKMKGDLLPERYRDIFANKQIVCVEYEELTDGDERDIFKRVQLGVPLTQAEKIQAISTPRTDLVRHLVKTFTTPETLGHPDVAWDSSRGRDFQAFSIFLYAAAKWNKKSGLVASVHTDPLKTWLSEGNAAPGKPKTQGNGRQVGEGVKVPEKLRTDVLESAEMVSKIAANRKYNFPFRAQTITSSLSSLEIAGAFILAYVLRVFHWQPQKTKSNKLSLKQLSSLFTLLRIQLREENADFIANSSGARVMMAICLEMSKDPLGALEEGKEHLEANKKS